MSFDIDPWNWLTEYDHNDLVDIANNDERAATRWQQYLSDLNLERDEDCIKRFKDQAKTIVNNRQKRL